MKTKRLCMVASVAVAGVMALLAAPSAQAQTYKVLHAFTGGLDGENPWAGVTQDAKGNLYGTTQASVFKISNSGKETVLHVFVGNANGFDPLAGVIQDAEGNLYGTTAYGGTTRCGCGVVFKLNKAGKETVLYRFTGGSHGGFPNAGVIQDAQGNLYGTTQGGGGTSCADGFGCGTVFKLSKTGKETVLYRFKGLADGSDPIGGVIRDAQGNIYGTTAGGGDPSCKFPGCGVVFKLTP